MANAYCLERLEFREIGIAKEECHSGLENNASVKNEKTIKQNEAIWAFETISVYRNCFAYLWANVRLKHLQWKGKIHPTTFQIQVEFRS